MAIDDLRAERLRQQIDRCLPFLAPTSARYRRTGVSVALTDAHIDMIVTFLAARNVARPPGYRRVYDLDALLGPSRPRLYVAAARGVRSLGRDDVEVLLYAEPMDVPFDRDSGDPVADAEDAAIVRARLARGDVWAWCVAVVKVRWGEYEGVAAIGGCTYHNAEDFKRCGYYHDLVDDALADLNAQRAEDAHRRRAR